LNCTRYIKFTTYSMLSTLLVPACTCTSKWKNDK